MTQTPATEKKSTAKTSSYERARQKFFDGLPKRMKCQTCGKSRSRDMFGVRCMNKPAVETKGAKPKFLVQARCTTCRH